MALGGALYNGDSKLFTGPLGVVRIAFAGYDLGKTTADATLVPDQDVKDIMYQQDGSKPRDHVRTGMEYILNATFGEIKTGLIKLLMAGVSSSEHASPDDSGIVDRSIFRSMLENEAGALKIAAVDENGIASADLEDIINFYEVIPIITGDLINWGADTQRNLPVEFRIKYHTWTAAELTTLGLTEGGAFGYWGDPTDEDVIPIVDYWLPEIVSAIANSATELWVTFSEMIDFQTDGELAVHYSLKLNGNYEEPSAVSTITAVADLILVITFDAATFTIDSDDEIFISISEDAIKDQQTPANNYLGVNNYPCEPWVT